MSPASPDTKCLNSKTTFNNYVVETRQKAVGSSPCESILEMVDSVAFTPAKERANVRVGDKFVVYIGGSYSQSGNGVSDTWYRYKMKIPSSGTAGAYIYSDDEQTLHESITGTPTYRTAYIALFQGAGGGGAVDWTFVREYASPEPTWGTWSGETGRKTRSYAYIIG